MCLPRPTKPKWAWSKTICSLKSTSNAKTNTPWQVPSTKDASPAFFPECNRLLSTSAWSATRSFMSPTLWSWKIPRTSTKFPPTGRCRSATSRNPRPKLIDGEALRAPVEPNRNRRNIRKQEPRIARRLRPASRATTVAVFAAAAAVADAAASACRNRSSPARQTEAPREAPRAERPERTERPERNVERNDAERSDPNFRNGGTIRTPCQNGTARALRIRPAAGISAHHFAGRVDLQIFTAGTDPGLRRSGERSAAAAQEQPAQPIAEIFADDEPIFAAASASPLRLRLKRSLQA